MLLGFTGLRGSGKTTLANLMVGHLGFARIHAFGPGLAMCEAYYVHLLQGIRAMPGKGQMTHARQLVYDPNFKDRPFRDILALDGHGNTVTLDQYLPGPNSRDFMEEIGKHMGVNMGPEYTLLAEIGIQRRQYPDVPLVCDSIVYEVEDFVRCGGIIVRVDRPQRDLSRKGEKTDEFVASIIPDYVYVNQHDKPRATLHDLNSWLARLRAGTLVRHVG